MTGAFTCSRCLSVVPTSIDRFVERREIRRHDGRERLFVATVANFCRSCALAIKRGDDAAAEAEEMALEGHRESIPLLPFPRKSLA